MLLVSNSGTTALAFVILSVTSGCASSASVSSSDHTDQVGRTSPLLRYGDLTPRPRNINDEALQLGNISQKLTMLGDGTAKTWRSSIEFEGRNFDIVIKPDETLTSEKLRKDIPVRRDNQRADAAYHLSRFVNLVDTPEHVIRDDAPLDSGGSRRGGAGVQIFIADAHGASPEDIVAVESTGALLGELEDIAVFDVIIGNLDRHDNNWLFRDNPRPGQRHIVAIDHSHAFPVSDVGGGTYNMIVRYLKSAHKGRISQRNLQKLHSLVSMREQIDAVLGLNLEDVAIEMIWSRVALLRQNELVFIP